MVLRVVFFKKMTFWCLQTGLSDVRIVSEYDQEIPKSQTADKPMVPRERATQQSHYTRKTN